MRPDRSRISGFSTYLILDIFLVVFGLILLLDGIPLPSIGFAEAFILAIVGLILIGAPITFTRRIGFVVFFVGSYFAFRSVGFISVAYLRYGLACFLLVVGIIGIVRDIRTENAQNNSNEEDETSL